MIIHRRLEVDPRIVVVDGKGVECNPLVYDVIPKPCDIESFWGFIDDAINKYNATVYVIEPFHGVLTCDDKHSFINFLHTTDKFCVIRFESAYSAPPNFSKFINDMATTFCKKSDSDDTSKSSQSSCISWFALDDSWKCKGPNMVPAGWW